MTAAPAPGGAKFGIISDGLLTTDLAQLPICTSGLTSARDYFELAKAYKNSPALGFAWLATLRAREKRF